MPMRVAIWGAPSAGKSALAKALSLAMGVGVIEEYATEWLRKHGLDAWHREGPRVQARFGEEQLARETRATKALGSWVTDSPSGLCWPYAAKRDDADPEVSHACYGVFANSLAGYTHHIFLPFGDFEYDQNGIRIAMEEAREMDRWLRAMLDMHGVGYLIVRGSVPQRVQAVKGYIGAEASSPLLRALPPASGSSA